MDEAQWWVEEDLIEGETVPRRYNRQYPEIVRNTRTDSIDFGVCAELQHIIRDAIGHFDGWQRETMQQAFSHLSDARNEGLPLNVREAHFDIAGALVWNAMQGHVGLNGDLASFIGTWKNAGGI